MSQCCEHSCPKDGIPRPGRHPIPQAYSDCMATPQQHKLTVQGQGRLLAFRMTGKTIVIRETELVSRTH